MVKRCLVFIALCLAFLSSQAFAIDTVVAERSRLAVAARQLAIDTHANTVTKTQIDYLKAHYNKQLEYYQTHPVKPELIRHIELDQIAAKASIDGKKIAITAAKDLQQDTENTIDFLTKERQRMLLLRQGRDLANDAKFKQTEVQLAVHREMFEIEKKRIDVLEQSLELAETRLALLADWYSQVGRLFQKKLRQTEVDQAAQQMSDLQASLQSWLDKLSTYNNELEQQANGLDVKEDVIRELQLKTIQASERIEMTRNEIWLLRQQSSIQSLRLPLHKVHTITHLNNLDRRATKTLQQLLRNKKYILRKTSYLNSKKTEYKHSAPESEKSKALLLLGSLEQDYFGQLNEVDQLTIQTTRFQQDIKVLLKQQLSVRQSLPSLDIESWLAVAGNALKMPNMLLHAMQTAFSQTKTVLKDMSATMLSLLLFNVMAAIGLCFYFRAKLLTLTTALEDRRDRFSTNVAYNVANILLRNIFLILILLALFGLSFFSGVHTKIFVQLILVYLFFRVLVTLARLTLLESIEDRTGEDVKLYRQARIALIVGGLLSAIIVVTHHLPVAYEVKALSNRLFMVFVLIAGIVIFLGRRIIPSLFLANLAGRRRYINHVLDLLSILVPLALVSNAVIGLFGYVELAWQISKYQGYFLVTSAGYLITRGLIIDLIDFASEYAIRSVRNGWVWVEAVLKPLDKIIRTGLFLLTVFVLALSFELDKNENFMTMVNNFFHWQLFEFGGNHINPAVLVKAFVVFTILYWAARWSREFSFRWAYAKSRDIGVRNSLAIFTQYLVVIIGVIISFQLLGISLKGFAVVAAAFAAGIGFGLRDMASNFFSGILLLMERPFRTGDIIQLGEFEGRIVHTGVRSLTIRTWDYMDVIVPNADMFTKPFVNWTHQDSIVRSLIKINVHRSDNPANVRQLILKVLENHPHVVEKPIAEVLMREISDTFIEMQVRYYVVVSANCSRVAVRSEVLFAIWETFKANHISSPVPQYNVQVEPHPELAQSFEQSK